MNKYVCASNSLRSGQLNRMLAKIKDSIPKEPKGERMKPTWKLIVLTSGKNSPNCKCLNCGKEFTFLGDSHFNMKLIKCPTCKQQVWVPRCPNGCPSFDTSDSRKALGDSIKFDDYIVEDAKNEERF